MKAIVQRGMPYLLRGCTGIRAPRDRIRGVDLSGGVEAVGRGVRQFKAGDEVFGGTEGSFAEYTVTTASRLAHKPPGLTHEEASTLHVAALTALQGLRDAARLQPGQRVIILGAGGGVGTFAVQIAKWLGAHVTAVTRTECVDAVRPLGADEVIDYRREDFAARAERHDVIFDIGGARSFADCRHVLGARGIMVVAGAPAGRWVSPVSRLAHAVALKPFVSQRIVPFISKNDAPGLALLAELAESGVIRPVIDRRYSFGEAAAAVRRVGSGEACGKVVITIA